MDLPIGFNMHRINDYILGKRSGLTKAQKLIAYHCVHLDYGRRKSGKFWKGASAIANDTDSNRKTVQKTLDVMEQRGWIKDTGETRSRARVWRIDYIALWNDSHVVGTDSRLMGNDSPSNGEPVGTNPPKEASEMNPLNKYADTVSAKPVGDLSEMRKKRSQPSSANAPRVQGQRIRRSPQLSPDVEERMFQQRHEREVAEWYAAREARRSGTE